MSKILAYASDDEKKPRKRLDDEDEVIASDSDKESIEDDFDWPSFSKTKTEIIIGVQNQIESRVERKKKSHKRPLEMRVFQIKNDKNGICNSILDEGDMDFFDGVKEFVEQRNVGMKSVGVLICKDSSNNKKIGFICYATNYVTNHMAIQFDVHIAYCKREYRRKGCLKKMIEELKEILKESEYTKEVQKKVITASPYDDSDEIWKRLGFQLFNQDITNELGYMWTQPQN